MSRQKAFTYLCLWLVLSAYYFAVEREPARETPAGPRMAVFLDLAAERVEAVELQAGGKRVRCVRAQPGWAVVEPVGAVVPSDLISAIVSAVTQTEPVELVGRGDGRAAEYGLAVPNGRIVLEGAGTPPVVLLIGDRNPAQTAVYARREGKPEIFLVGLNVQYYLDLAVENL